TQLCLNMVKDDESMSKNLDRMRGVSVMVKTRASHKNTASMATLDLKFRNLVTEFQLSLYRQILLRATQLPARAT
ncbi:hypothetical protein A2U01_0058099, partial [Trifolium medium]|nr:hypothetical protein [Trifolium medium]